MSYQTLNDYKEEEHPWDPYIPPGSDKLILGTFPTAERNRKDIDFFYPNPNNQFWNVLLVIETGNGNIDIGTTLSKEQRIALLQKLNLGISDICYRVFRHKESSIDTDIFVIEYRDILELLHKHPKINKLLFTSSSGIAQCRRVV